MVSHQLHLLLADLSSLCPLFLILLSLLLCFNNHGSVHGLTPYTKVVTASPPPINYRPISVAWFESYFSDRCQITHVSDSFSSLGFPLLLFLKALCLVLLSSLLLSMTCPLSYCLIPSLSSLMTLPSSVVILLPSTHLSSLMSDCGQLVDGKQWIPTKRKQNRVYAHPFKSKKG